MKCRRPSKTPTQPEGTEKPVQQETAMQELAFLRAKTATLETELARCRRRREGVGGVQGRGDAQEEELPEYDTEC